jgi:hypothetical protein
MPEPWPQIVAPAGPPWFGISLYQLPHFLNHKINAFMTQHALNGGNILEIFGPIAWGGYHLLQPYLHRPGLLEPDKYPVVWDLDHPNPLWWERLDLIMRNCFDTKIQLVIRVLDYCSYKRDVDAHRWCFRACVQRVEFPEKDPRRLTGGLYGVPIRKYYGQFIDMLLSYARKNGIRPWFVPMNEADYIHGEGETEADADNAVMGIHRWMASFLQERGVTADEIIISTSRAFDTMKKWGYRMELHGINSPVRMNAAIAKYGVTNVFMNGDGPDPYAAGEVGDAPDKKLPSFDQAIEMGSIMRKTGLDRWAGFNRKPESVSPANIDLATFDVLEGLRRGFGL